jgi:dTDP-4-amino-4,6-dideoxygalactose transaminase
MSNSWPLGELPRELMRPEPELIKSLGYTWDDPRDIVSLFETKLAEFAGTKYAVTVDCCSHGLFLGLKYLRASGGISIPCHTYQSVPMQIIHAGCYPVFRKEEWSGVYKLSPYTLYDAATRGTKGMFEHFLLDDLAVVSFQIKKRLPIGRGGAIFTNNKLAYEWFKKARYDGRDLEKYSQWDDPCNFIGWHYYMTPEDAARGIFLMDKIPEVNEDSANWKNYSDLSRKFQ